MSQILVTGEAKIRDIQGPVVANSGVITALDGAASQYVRGDGTLADFPTSTGGGSSVSYYLNSSISQGTIGGVAYRQLSKTPISGAGTDITASTNGYIASYITDANDPSLLEVPAGNFNCEFYFSVNSNNHNPYVYAELYKYNGTTFTLLGSNVAIPEYLTNGTTLSAYYFAIPVAVAALTITDRLAIRIYANVDTRVVTLHTENNHLCQVVTTFSKGLTTLNNLTRQVQFLGTGTSGTDFNIASSVATHTFNLPVASATNTGKLSSTDWSTFNGKVPYTGAIASVDLGIYSLDASELFTNGNGIYIKKNLSGIANSVGYVALSSSTYKLNVAEASSATNAKIFNFDFSTLTDTTLSVNNTRTYTLPNLSGTLALLEGSQTFSGAKTFSGLASFTNTSGINLQYGAYINKGNTPLAFSSGTTNIYSDATTNNIVIRDNSSIAKLEFNNSTQTYTFPAASGTIALTSNISYPVTSVFGRTGAVVATSGDYTTTQVTEGTNLYYTDARARGALSFTAGSGAYNSTTGVITIPTNNNQITNGAGYITSSALSAYLPLTGGTLTGALSLTYATPYLIFNATSGNSNNMSFNVGGTQVGLINISSSFFSFFNNTSSGYLFKNSAGTNVFTIADNGQASLSSTLGLGGALSGTSATFSGALQVGGTGSSTITIGDAVGSAADSNLRLRTGSTKYAWLIASQNNVAGFEITPSTAVGGTTFSTPAFTILPSGNVGIGTSSPVDYTNYRSLHISGASSTSSAILYLTNSTSSIRGLFFAEGSANRVTIGSQSNHDFTFLTNDTERMRITSGGNVLIGTTSTALLGLATIQYGTNSTSNPTLLVRNGGGSAAFVSFSDSDAATTLFGWIVRSGSGVNYASASDYRLKQDLKEYEGLSLISKIKTYDYEWKSDNSRSYGVIAHELQEVIPYAVTGEKDGENMQGVDYSKLVPLLIKAIQELKAEIDELKNK